MTDFNAFPQDTTEHILEDEVMLVQASRGKRFLNYIIDAIVFFVLVVIVSIISVLSSPGYVPQDNDTLTGNPLLERIVWLLIYGAYMFIMEAIFKGKSIGKLITGTCAVNQDGTRISIKTALMRGLARAVPFEAFSALSDPSFPWHDKWTDTYVIDVKQSSNLPLS